MRVFLVTDNYCSLLLQAKRAVSAISQGQQTGDVASCSVWIRCECQSWIASPKKHLSAHAHSYSSLKLEKPDISRRQEMALGNIPVCLPCPCGLLSAVRPNRSCQQCVLCISVPPTVNTALWHHWGLVTPKAMWEMQGHIRIYPNICHLKV